ncbi:MAG: hypothetical protein DCF26_14425 [Burkholderiales bacterium]|nr:MAG: hypothetical protein DCF26_14425 [Burkholderiales bacterium]
MQKADCWLRWRTWARTEEVIEFEVVWGNVIVLFLWLQNALLNFSSKTMRTLAQSAAPIAIDLLPCAAGALGGGNVTTLVTASTARGRCQHLVGWCRSAFHGCPWEM